MTPELTLMNTNEAGIMDTLQNKKKKRNSVEGSDGKKKAKRATEAVADEAEEEEVPEAEAEDPGVTAEEDQGTEKAKATEEEVLEAEADEEDPGTEKAKATEEEVPEAEADEEDPGVTAEEDQGTEKAKATEEEVPEADPGVTAEEDQGTEKAKETTASLLVGHPEKTVTPAQEAKETTVPRCVGRPKKTVTPAQEAKETTAPRRVGRPKKTVTPAQEDDPETEEAKETTAPRRVGRPKKTVTPAQEDDPETEEAKEITALRAKNKLDERRTNPKSTSGKRGAVSYEDMFKNTKILTHNTDTEGNMVRVEGIAEFNRETKSFNVFWETEDEPPLLKLSKQDMDVLVTNSKQLDLTGLIESCIGYTVVTKHSFWLHELPICITDKHNVPIIIQYDTRPISTEYIKLGDSLMINVDIDPDMLTETLQLELVAYDVESVYIKYVTWFIENSNLKMEMEMSFTKMNRVEYGELDVGRLNLGTFDEHNWPMWYKKYHVCDKYSTEFLEYVRLCEK